MTAEDFVRDVIVASPFGRLVGVRLVEATPGRVRVALPFRPEVTTVGDVVHGGAIAGLVDVAATAAVWSTVEPGASTRGTTVGFTVNFLAAGRGTDLVATASVIQRGQTLAICDVEVRAAADAPVARALVTYKLG